MSYLSDSELIITREGRIYHLGLHPDEIADTIITVGDPGRVARVSRHFDHLDTQVSKREFVTHTGRIGQKRITVLSTGIGPDNIDIAVNELDALANYDFSTRLPKAQPTRLRLIRLGTCGAIQEDIAPGQQVISRFGLGLDNLMRYYAYQNTPREQALLDALDAFQQTQVALPVPPYVFEGNPTLSELLGKDTEQVITLTSPGFYGPQGRQLRAPVRLAAAEMDTLRYFRYEDYRIANFEMETSALFGLARLLGHEAISCNVVLGNRIKKTFLSDPYAHIDQMIAARLEQIVAM